MRDLVSDIRKSIVFLGRINDGGEKKFFATGFLVETKSYFHLVTAKHVVVDPRTGKPIDSGMSAFFNSKDGHIRNIPIELIKNELKVNWIFHKNKKADIAIIPFGLDPQKDDVRVISEELFLTTDRLFELYDVFFLSYQPGIESQRRIAPVLRKGTISLLNDDNTFYIDAFAFPGNSGSPVFLKPSPIRFDKEGISIGGDPLGGKFIGIIGEYIPYQEFAISEQTGRPRVMFEENTGISRVWSVTFLNEILQSNEFKQQFDGMIRRRRRLSSIS